MSFLQNFRPGGFSGTAEQRLEIQRLTAKRDQMVENHERKMKFMREKLKDLTEDLHIATGLRKQREQEHAKFMAIADAKHQARLQAIAARADREIAEAQRRAECRKWEMLGTVGIFPPEI